MRKAFFYLAASLVGTAVMVLLIAAFCFADVATYGGVPPTGTGTPVKVAETGAITGTTTDWTGRAALTVVDRRNQQILESIDIRNADISMNQIEVSDTMNASQRAAFLEDELR